MNIYSNYNVTEWKVGNDDITSCRLGKCQIQSSIDSGKTAREEERSRLSLRLQALHEQLFIVMAVKWFYQLVYMLLPLGFRRKDTQSTRQTEIQMKFEFCLILPKGIPLGHCSYCAKHQFMYPKAIFRLSFSASDLLRCFPTDI